MRQYFLIVLGAFSKCPEVIVSEKKTVGGNIRNNGETLTVGVR